MLQRLYYQSKRAVGNLTKSLLINSITMATIAMALFLFSGYQLFLQNISGWLSANEAALTIKLYLNPTVTPAQVDTIRAASLLNPHVASLHWMSAEESRADFVNRHPDFKPLLDGLNENPFQPIIAVRLKDNQSEWSRLTAESLQTLPEVESVDYGGRWLSRYIALKGGFELASTALTALIILACIFLIANTIRLNLYSRKEEIEIFKLVGGTRIFIATPFVLEGMLLGLLGCVVALAALWGLFEITSESLHAEKQLLTGGLKLGFLDLHGVLIVGLTAVAAGFLGSLISLRQFLRYR